MTEPMPATSGASTAAITSYSPVMASASSIPLTPWRDLATSIAFPADALISTYARIAPSWTNLDLQNTALVAGKMVIMTSMTAVVKAAAGPGAEIDQVAIPEPKG